MTWLEGTIIFVVGFIVGLLVMRLIPQLSGKNHQLSEQLNDHIKAQESFKKDVDSYLASVNDAMQNIAKQATQAADESQQRFSELAAVQKEHKEFVPFFGAETASIMQQSRPVESLSKTLNEGQAEAIPRDYSDSKMGWFSAEDKK
ncbi:ZapG family protein [Catenovulum sediminis]|uniref:DUF1043 family protein n=1 Tax=Catenovulum sediminis TaxID=1740262 RepID=A0ABV1RKU9_9ALTE|nr:DUF1043 family protein [Catenovulum sediminis]